MNKTRRNGFVPQVHLGAAVTLAAIALLLAAWTGESGNPVVSGCSSRSEGLMGVIHIANGCSFPINAVNCREYTYRDSYCHFRQYQPGEQMDTLSNGSLVVDGVFPSRIHTYAC